MDGNHTDMKSIQVIIDLHKAGPSNKDLYLEGLENMHCPGADTNIQSWQ